MSETTLLDRLRSSEILSMEQLRELSGLPEARDPDPKVLGKVVLQRGWLTRFQISQTAMGKGKELFVGPYVLQDRLGEGGMGQVFKARHRHMKRVVALKLMRKEKLGSEDAVQRFYQEVEAAAQLTHPNIVLAFDAGQAGNLHFFSMEYVEGTDLTRLVREKGPLPVAQACDFIRQAAMGLQHAHEQGMVHRDIKPSNLLVTAGEKSVVKILDMGLARLGDTFAKERNLTKVGQVLGTPDYLAPEQAIDARHVDIRADIYSLGCSLFFLLTRRAPFQAESLAELLMKHQMQEPTSLRSLRPDAPPALEDLLRRLLAKKPEQRPATPDAVATALELFARGEKGVPAPAPVSVSPPSPAVGGETFAGLTDDGEGPIARPPRSKRDRTHDTVDERPRRGKSKEAEKKSGKALLIAVGIGSGALVLLLTAVGLIFALGSSKKPEDHVVQSKTLPDQPPTPAGGPRPPAVQGESPLKLVADGPIFTVVEDAVREGKISRTPLLGRGPTPFAEVPAKGALLVGLKVGVGKRLQQDVVYSLQPIFETRKAKSSGRIQGTEQMHFITVEAKPGYAVGGLTVSGGTRIHGLSVTFMAVEGKKLNPAQSYQSEWIGGRSGGPKTALGNDGFPVVGVFGKLQPGNAVVNGLGLVTLAPVKPPVLTPALPPRPLVAGTIGPLEGQVEGQVDGFRVGSSGILIAARFVKDVKRAVIGSPLTIDLYDLENKRRLRTFAVGNTIWRMAVTADGKTLAASDRDGLVHAWDVESGKEQHQFKHAGKVWQLAFSPDGKHLAVAARTAEGHNPKTTRGGYGVMLWDLQTKNSRPVSLGKLMTMAPQWLAFSQDGEMLMVGNVQNPLLAWKVQTQILDDGKSPPLPNSRCFTPINKTQVLIAANNGDIHLWDREAGQTLRIFRGHSLSVHEMKVLPGGKQFVSIGGRKKGAGRLPPEDATLRLWDVDKGTEVGRATFPQPPGSLDIASDGGTAIVSDRDGSVRLIDLRKLGATAAPVVRQDAPVVKPVQAVKPDASAGKPAGRFVGHRRSVNSIAFSPDGKKLLSGGEDGTARFWDARTGRETKTSSGSGAVLRVRFTRNGKWAIIAGNRETHVIDGETGTLGFMFRHPLTPEVCANLSADGLNALITEGKGVLVRYRYEPERARVTNRSLSPAPVKRTCAAFSPDGGLYFDGDEAGMGTIYDATTNKILGNYNSPRGHGILCLAVLQGKTLSVLTGGSDKNIVIRSGAALVRFTQLSGHEGSVTGLSLSANGKILASCSKDKTVRVWELATKKQLHKFTSEEEVHDVSLSPDARSIAFCGAKGIRVHDLRPAPTP